MLFSVCCVRSSREGFVWLVRSGALRSHPLREDGAPLPAACSAGGVETWNHCPIKRD